MYNKELTKNTFIINSKWAPIKRKTMVGYVTVFFGNTNLLIVVSFLK